MELLKNLELVEVAFENDNKKAVLTFLDKEHGEIRVVNFNKQVYQDGSFIDDKEKSAKVDDWCKTYFDLPFKELTKAVGTEHDIYAYDNFNSLFEVDVVSKFDKDMVGQIINTKIKQIIIDEYAIRIRFEYEGNTYESKMTYAKYMEDMKQWFVDPLKKKTIFTKFKDKFGVEVEHCSELEGKNIIVEVKTAFNKFVYAEIKPFPKKK